MTDPGGESDRERLTLDLTEDRHVVLPLIRSAHDATEESASPERMAEILMESDVEDLSD